MTEDVKNLLLSEVQRYNHSDYSRCRVHYNGIVGEGRDWAYRTGGTPFEFEITPVQAYLLSRLEDSMQRTLTIPELQIMRNVPAKLKNRTSGVGFSDVRFNVTYYAQIAQYDLLK